MNIFYLNQKEKENGYTLTECLNMFGCSKSGYYAWLDHMLDRDGKHAAKKAEKQEIMDDFRKIIARRGYVPGKRTFHTEMWRRFEKHVSIKRCAKIMKEMNLKPNKPKKDAYKHQATHNHECTAPENKVCQNFYIGPRRVILTDITYLYFGLSRETFYLCTFKDACTKEILGRDMSDRMTVDLVKAAYDQMMEKHGKELKGVKDVYIHSDQGSQYLSTSFRQVLEDDGFIQSVSGRGNSQDNSPMESFFSHMKTAILDLVALCPDLETAIRLVNGYIDSYNSEFYQYNLAGLTPEEYYSYVSTGIYPLDNYYGVKSTELRSVTDLVNDRRKKAEEKNAKDRAAYARKSKENNKLKRSPLQILARDQKKLLKELEEWKDSKEICELQIKALEKILEKTKEAGKFIRSVSPEIYESLRTPQNWKEYPELSYVKDMKEMY